MKKRIKNAGAESQEEIEEVIKKLLEELSNIQALRPINSFKPHMLKEIQLRIKNKGITKKQFEALESLGRSGTPEPIDHRTEFATNPKFDTTKIKKIVLELVKPLRRPNVSDLENTKVFSYLLPIIEYDYLAKSFKLPLYDFAYGMPTKYSHFEDIFGSLLEQILERNELLEFIPDQDAETIKRNIYDYSLNFAKQIAEIGPDWMKNYLDCRHRIIGLMGGRTSRKRQTRRKR